MTDHEIPSTGSSRFVPRLTHRRPLPRRLADRLSLAGEGLRRFPVATITILLLIASGLLFYRYITGSEYFSLERIEVTGEDRLAEARILEMLRTGAGIEPGASTARLDLALADAILRDVPVVLDVTMEREWPDALLIRVEEREAAAILVTGRDSFVVDGGGLILSAARSADFLRADLPILTGFAELAAEPGKQLPADGFQAAMNHRRVIRRAMPSLAARIGEYNWHKEGGMTLILEDGMRFECGFRPPAETGPVIETLLALEDGTQLPIVNVNLQTESCVTVRRQDPPKGTRRVSMARTDKEAH